MVVLGYLSTKVGIDEHWGAQFPSALADPDEWKATNRKMANMFYVIFSIFGISNLAFYILGVSEVFSMYSVVFLLMAAIIETIYLYFYFRKSFEKEENAKIARTTNR